MNKIYVNNPILASNTILMKAVSLLYLKNYSDIIFQNNLTNTLIKAKYSNVMDEVGQLSKSVYDKFLCNLKLGLNLNFLQKSHIHQSSFPVKVNNTLYSFRVSIHPSYSGENICLRIIRSNYFVKALEDFEYDGLTIIGGKTGSGKTTLYYSLIKECMGNVVSLEDPVEYPIYGVNQTDVSKCGYEEGLKSILRQVPDLIGIGEIRDAVSARAVFNTVLTGHAVVTTIHFSTLEQLKYRLLQFDINPRLITKIIFMNDKKPELLNHNNLLT